MPVIKWTPYKTPLDQPFTDASLSALASGAYLLGTVVDNSVDLHTYGDLSLVFNQTVTPTGSASLSVFLTPLITGNNSVYPYGNGVNPGAGYLAGGLSVANVSVSAFLIRGLVLPPFPFRFILLNSLGVPFPTGASANTSRLSRYSEQSV